VDRCLGLDVTEGEGLVVLHVCHCVTNTGWSVGKGHHKWVHPG
jgi:hypothetical protein